MDVNEILARLDAGATADEIAAEMTEALNKAQKVRAEQLKANQEKEEKEAHLDELASAALDALNAYLGAELDIESMDIDVAEFRHMSKKLAPFIDFLDDVEIHVEKFPMKETLHKINPKAKRTAEDVFANFLNTMGW